jgi:predicted nucleotidyltransferase
LKAFAVESVSSDTAATAGREVERARPNSSGSRFGYGQIQLAYSYGLIVKRLEEHDTIAAEERALLTRCREAIRSVDPDAKVILYGSRARGSARADSDYDLLILVNGPMDVHTEARFRQQLFPIELETSRVLTVIAYSESEWNTPLYRAMPFRENVETDGVML